MVMIRTLRAQAAQVLREQVGSEYKTGDRLPPEPELAKRMGLSRNTVREAIAELVTEGLLERRWGVGTTVLARRAQAAFSVTDVVPIWRIIEAAGHEPSLARFSSKVLPVPEAVASELRLKEGIEMVYIERLFAVDGVVAVYLRDWCPTHIAGAKVDVSTLADVNNDLPALLREQTGTVLVRIEGRFDAVMASGDFINDERPMRPLIQISQSGMTRDDNPIVYSTIQFDTSVVDLTVRRVFSAN
jgi:GntR family transcriptional regulator